MTLSDAEIAKLKIQYKLEPPEGGWGYMLAISMAVMFIVTVGPLAAFGIIYGKYLASIGDEASATAMINCIFNTVLCFMGLVANHLLQKHSSRFVGVFGSVLFFLGNFLTTFASSVWQMMITFGVLQGVGFGLMLTATFASFNEYFIRRKNFVMGISQTMIAAGAMVMPYLARILMDEFGYRGTVAIFSALSLHCVLAMITLQPVEWHMIQVPVSTVEMSFLPSESIQMNEKCLKNIEDNEKYFLNLPTVEIPEEPSGLSKLWNSIYDFLELSLLRDPSYVNISVGISLSFMSDIMFLSLLPMFLYHMEFNHDEIAYLVTAYMVADLLGRLLLSLFTAVIKIGNRILFLWGTVLITVFRIGFSMMSGWLWILIIIILLGLFRGLVQVTVPLALAEYSQTKFSAAFGLYLTICGIVSLASGQLSSLVASVTTGDIWVQHLLTLQLLLCVIPWTVELLYKKIKK